ncbi:BTAD domain-containing putative transcriptional regulator [Streptomyces sp. NPDC007346]|uniref:BTAD domain-containing putative transcriptional regulator n=1 Tax=Streptomyces sp. NPDC007346 TaxID=3154682 RepID=UPI003454CEFE
MRSLLTLLLTDPGRVLSAERLIDGVYGSRPPEGAARALQSQVSRLRQVLGGDGALLEFQQGGYRLDVELDAVDAHRFAALAAEGRAELAAGAPGSAATLLREALGLWRGAALCGTAQTPATTAWAARLEELRDAAREDLAEAELLRGGRAGPLVAELGTLVAANPLRERPRGQLMRALHACGRTAEALALYEETRRVLAAELGTEPGAELRAVHLAVLRDTPDEPPAAPVAPASVTGGESGRRTGLRRGLAAQFTSFVGREDALRQLDVLLDRVRLVTLTGPGGAGKTRLASEAAARREQDVCLVELAPDSRGADIARTVLDALGPGGAEVRTPAPPGRHGRPPGDTAQLLARALSGSRLLLVLDNCEHVVADVAELAGRLLGSCPDLVIMATSREPLDITGETLYPVPPLELPPPGPPPAAEDAAHYPAVRLFADRAGAVSPDFALDAGTIRDVLRICRALDGLPLALELAAARLRSLPVGELAARLDDRFALLSRGSRTAAARHRTLTALVEWSWDLLSEDERVLVRRFAVFPGAAGPQAVERVCGLPSAPLPSADGSPTAPSSPAGEVDAHVLDLLTSLADKSLLTPVPGEASFRMLETVRAYCLQRLAEAGETRQVRRAHAAYVTELIRAAAPHLRDADHLPWLSRLTAAHDDVTAALRWATREDPGLALRLGAELWPYWWLRSPAGEGAERMREVLCALGTVPPPELAAEYVTCVVGTALGMAPDAELRAHLAAAGKLAEGLDTEGAHPLIVLARPVIALVTGDHDAPLPTPPVVRFEENPSLRLGTCQVLGLVYAGRGEPERAERQLDLALEGFRASGERLGAIQVLPELARLARWRGDHDRALALLDQGIALAAPLASATNEAYLLCRRADERRRSGDLPGAEADCARGELLARRAGATGALAAARHTAGENARLRGDLPAARRLHLSALDLCSGTWLGEEVRLRTLTALGRIAEAEGDLATARARHAEALEAVLTGWELPTVADTAEGLAGALLPAHPALALTVLGAATTLRGTTVATDHDVARVSATAQRLIGPHAGRSAHAKGAAMSRNDALRLLGEALSAVRQ